MADVAPVALGALLLAAVQAVGVVLMLALGRDGEEATTTWLTITGWPVWLPLYAWSALREHLGGRRG